MSPANLPSAGSRAPWLQPDVFPEKPAGFEYGYYQGRKPVGCSRSELESRGTWPDLTEIRMVWTPDQTRIVAINEVPFLLPTLKEWRSRSMRATIGLGLVWTVLLGGMIWAHGGALPSLFPILLLILCGIMPVVSGIVGLYRLRRITLEQLAAQAPVARFSGWVSLQDPRPVYVLLALLGFVGLSQMLRGNAASIAHAGLIKSAVRSGEFWRLATGPLLHANYFHFVANASALYYLGRLTRSLAGTPTLALVFASSMLSGSLFSCWLMPDTNSVGASGGLLGLIGFLLVLGWKYRAVLPPRFFPSLLTAVALTGIIGAAFPRVIDNAGHLGGLLCGLGWGAGLIRQTNARLPLASGFTLKTAGLLAWGGLAASTALAFWTMGQ